MKIKAFLTGDDLPEDAQYVTSVREEVETIVRRKVGSGSSVREVEDVKIGHQTVHYFLTNDDAGRHEYEEEPRPLKRRKKDIKEEPEVVDNIPELPEIEIEEALPDPGVPNPSAEDIK